MFSRPGKVLDLKTAKIAKVAASQLLQPQTCALSNLKCSNHCSGAKVEYFDLRCSGVEVKLLEIGNTEVQIPQN